MIGGNQQLSLDEQREIEAEINEALTVLGLWSHVFDKLEPAEKDRWRAVVTKAQLNRDRTTVRSELDNFISEVLRPAVSKLA